MFLQINDTQQIQINTHLLIAGSSGSGKSVTLHALILSAMKQGYKLALIDPKRVELSFYKNIIIIYPEIIEKIQSIIPNKRFFPIIFLIVCTFNEVPII